MPRKKKSHTHREEPQLQERTTTTATTLSVDTTEIDKSTIKQIKNKLSFSCPACSTLLKNAE